jgi:leucyl aminopeptidase
MPDRPAAPRAATDVPAGTAIPRFTLSHGNLASARADLTICFAHEGEPIRVDGRSGSPLARTLTLVARHENFRARKKDLFVWQSGGRYPAARYLVVGLGKPEHYGIDAVRDACGFAARKAISLPRGGPGRIALSLPTGPLRPRADAPGAAAVAQAVVEGIALGAYRLSKYHTAEEAGPPALHTVEVHAGRPAGADTQAGLAAGRVRAEAVNLARDVVNEPAIVVTPMKMAEVARRVAQDRGLEIKVLEKADLERQRMGAILGVSAGSDQPPCLIHLVYRPKDGGRRARLPRIALVGKGLTFDSGGLSLKTASGMETMKLDKAGATAVLAAMSAVAQLKPRVEVHGIMAMTENMPGGSALKPGDILTAMGGKTIEVLNTDAEGRVVLADALAYAQRHKPDQIIDLATLTGACMVALGSQVTGVFGNDQPMVDRFLDAARRAGEKCWQLPLVEEYCDHLRSEVADLKNTPGTRYGGAITAGLFLRSFIENGVPWLHLDIAGPAFMESEQGYMRKGATGATVRTLLTYIQSLSPSS